MSDEELRPRLAHAFDGIARFALIGSGIVISAAYSALTPVLPIIQDHFRSEPNIGLLVKSLVMAIGVAMVIVSPWVGLMARLLGHTRLLVVAMVIYAIAGSAASLSNEIWILIASRVVVGICTAVISVLVVATIVKIGDASLRARILGQWVACSSFGLVLLLPVVGFLGEVSWRAPFVLHLISLPFAISFARVKIAELDEEQHDGGHLEELLANRRALYYVGFAFIIGCINLGIPLFFPYLLRDMGLYSPSVASNLFLISVLAAALAALNFGKLRAVVSLPQLFALGLVLVSLGLVLLVLSRETTLLVVAQALSGIGGGIVAPALSLGAGAMALRGQETSVVGLAKGAYSLGLFAGPALLQPVATSNGTVWVFVLAATMAALSALGALAFLRGPSSA